MNTKKLMRGVNLGGWLVVEKWMTPSLFSGTTASDEFELSQTDDGISRIKQHRQEFITEQDFKWLRDNGIQAIRIPIGFWIVEDVPSYLAGLERLDWAFKMAQKYNLAVLLCLHGAPGSQNGKVHSGKRGKIDWYKRAHRDKTFKTLVEIAQRYGSQKVLWGVELLNEPATTSWIQSIQLRHWTARTMSMLSKCLRPGIKLVYSDVFRPDKWSGRIKNSQAVMDVHHYQCFSEKDKKLNLDQHLQKVSRVADDIDRWCNDQPVVIGEWSLALDNTSIKYEPIDTVRQNYATAQLEAYKNAEAWFFWSYKTEQQGGWNFRFLIEKDIISFK